MSQRSASSAANGTALSAAKGNRNVPENFGTALPNVCAYCHSSPSDDVGESYAAAAVGNSRKVHGAGKVSSSNTTCKKLKACTRCKKVKYCDRKCQRAHYKEHKKVCYPAQAKKAPLHSEQPSPQNVTNAYSGSSEMSQLLLEEQLRVIQDRHRICNELFSDLDRSMVLYFNPMSNPWGCYPIEEFMGVYTPLDGETFGGLPLWAHDERRSLDVAAFMTTPDMKKSLGRGVSFAFEATDFKLYMYVNSKYGHWMVTGNKPVLNSEPQVLLQSGAPMDEFERQLQYIAECNGPPYGKSEIVPLIKTNPLPVWYYFDKDQWEWVTVEIRVMPLTFIERLISPRNKKGNGGKTKSGTNSAAGKKRREEAKQAAEVDRQRQEELKKAEEEKRQSEEAAKRRAAESKRKQRIEEERMAKEERERELAERERREKARATQFAEEACDYLLFKFKLKRSSKTDSWPAVDSFSVDELVPRLFDTSNSDRAWLLVNDSVTAPIIEKVFDPEWRVISRSTYHLIHSRGEAVLDRVCDHERMKDMIALVKAGIPVKASLLCRIFSGLPESSKNAFANKLVSTVKLIQLTLKTDYKSVLIASSKKLGKNARKSLVNALKKGDAEFNSARFDRRKKSVSSVSESTVRNNDEVVVEGIPAENTEELDVEKEKNRAVVKAEVAPSEQRASYHSRIESLLHWYEQTLSSYADDNDSDSDGTESEAEEQMLKEDCSTFNNSAFSPGTPCMTSDEISSELASCSSLPVEKQDEVIELVERRVDLSSFAESEWTIDMTEQAHKWFQKRIKKQRHLCERVIRRLKLLSTGRWPYVLCKPLKTRHKGTKSVKLYESKIDAARRIIWEVAVSFSPRRSTATQSFCEEVVRVWDIVEDHDNLSRAINRTVERIEKSHLRGQECMLYAEIQDGHKSIEDVKVTDSQGDCLYVPNVYAMRQKTKCQPLSTAKDSSSRFYAPASEDLRQYTLLKFYELNSDAIKILLDDQSTSSDLPFIPTPKEHEIINFTSNPKRSLLLIGRSGTGKTTCLVFRMWAVHMAYQQRRGPQPRQMFLTKNDVLRNEVKKAFSNMGLAWRRKSEEVNCDSVKVKESNFQALQSSQSNTGIRLEDPSGSKTSFNFADHPAENQASLSQFTSESGATDGHYKEPLFLTSTEWLDSLDAELPGEKFFTANELSQRESCSKQDDSVKRGIDAFFEGEANAEEHQTVRKEITYSAYRSMWRKVNSRHRSWLDPSLVWLEIKSYIKGSVAALKLDCEDRDSPSQRFLSLQEYLSLPRKQSRLEESKRREVYALFESYEKLKRQGNCYDEMDVVYNLAGRVMHFRRNPTAYPGLTELLTIDSTFVDEVQDFTQAELFLITKISRDPNNLMLAGDTAQSIAVGVGFRFTDVRQIFYQSFGGIEPRLLQLTHNYRSHAGVLRLAACVIELLYFFFNESLDRLPPDQGLFAGPKPVIMEVASVSDLVLMMEGSRRETSRIEFGAHQVVIVRNEEAKNSLPDEFNVDRDWVMTVQQSKGLEFDDVLLYNFFTDSDAQDVWRVVSQYKVDDIAAYYESDESIATGVQSFEWNEVDLPPTRPLQFNHEEHKVLEAELKQLYTAITRARVNVFIAESDSKVCRPVFNYFRARGVVDIVDKDSKGGERIFGKMSSLEDWQKRGEYYLQHAEGNRMMGCLRLASKCFDKAGDKRRRDHTLAYLAFVEVEAEASDKKRHKSTGHDSGQFYQIAVQLLEAQDVGFLNKAALCLLKISDVELPRSARIFDLYARLLYAERNRKRKKAISSNMSVAILKPSSHEQQYFTYAAKLYVKCMSLPNIQQQERRTFMMKALRNFLCTGSEEELKHAATLIVKNLAHCQHDFKRLVSLCSVHHTTADECKWFDPISFYHRFQQQSPDACREILNAVKTAAGVACRQYHQTGDEYGVRKALGCISARNDRLRVLESLANNTDQLIKAAPWSCHPAFKSDGDPHKRTVDVTKLLTEQLDENGEFYRAAELLEARGLLVEAADYFCRDAVKSESHASLIKALECRTRYVELVVASRGASLLRKEMRVPFLLELLDYPPGLSSDVVPTDINMSMLMSKTRLENADVSYFLDNFHTMGEAIMWKFVAFKWAVDNYGLETVFDTHSNKTVRSFWDSTQFVIAIVREMREVATELVKSSLHQSGPKNGHAAQVETYFELKPDSLSMHHFSTQVVSNMRLRGALLGEKMRLADVTSVISPSALTASLEQKKLYPLLAQHICHIASSILVELDKVLCKKIDVIQSQSTPAPSGFSRYALVLQARLVCHEAVMQISKEKDFASFKETSWWEGLTKDAKKALENSVQDIINMALSSSCTVNYERSVLIVLRREAGRRWVTTPLGQKIYDMNGVIRQWQVLNLCGASEDAIRIIEKNISSLESSRRMKDDVQSGRNDHILPMKEGGRVQSIARLWTMAVDSVNRAKDPDLFGSLKLVHTLVVRTQMGGLQKLKRDLLLQLLEVNTAGLFGALSLRYNNLSTHFWCILPEQSYLENLLLRTGPACGQCYGILVKNILESTCHKNFFHFFSEFFRRLEMIAGLVLDSGLLSLSFAGKKSSLRENKFSNPCCFERAFILSAIILFNAAVASSAGRAMNRAEIESNVDELPRLPLCGKIRDLLGEIRALLRIKQKLPVHIRTHVAYTRGSDLNLADLMQAVDDMLKGDRSPDRLVRFRIHQVDGATTITKETRLGDCLSLQTVPLDENKGVWLDGMNTYHELIAETNTEIEREELASFSEDSDKRKAVIEIQKSWRSYTAPPKADPCLFFRHWKGVMTDLTRLCKKHIERKLQEIKEHLPESTTYLPDDTNPSLGPLNGIADLWNSPDFISGVKDWIDYLAMNNPVFDGIECQFCGIVNNPHAHRLRMQHCSTFSPPGTPYSQAVLAYNMHHFQNPNASLEANALQHQFSPDHQRNVDRIAMGAQGFKREISEVLSHLQASLRVLQNIMSVCDQQGHSDSWYIALREEAGLLCHEIRQNFDEIRQKTATFWPPPPDVPVLLQRSRTLSFSAQRLYADRLEEERQYFADDDGKYFADDDGKYFADNEYVGDERAL